jgi:hypothetical protein
MDMLREILKDPERKPISVMIRDLVYLFLKYKELPVHYFSRYLFKKGVRNIQDYVPNRLSGEIAPYFNDSRVKQVLDNKLLFSMFYGQFGLNMPVILAFNHLHLFVTGGEIKEIKKVEEFRDFLAGIFQSAPGCETLFLKRIYSSSSGRNIHLVHSRMVENEDPLLSEIFQQVRMSEFVFQKKVKQHPDLDRLNPASLNTMRIDTFIDSEGNIDIISGFLKMSTNNQPVDNSTTGGCGVGIDLNTGKLRGNGYSKLKISGVGLLTEHPMTGVKFEGFHLPMIHEAQSLVLKAASLMPGLRLVGWDVGFAEDGPVLVEGNSDYGINSNDMMYGGYFSNEKFMKVLSEFKKR